MADDSNNYNPALPRNVEDIFEDFEARRAAIVKALISDSAQFYEQCDPEKLNLCLYGHPDKRWQVTEPLGTTPPEIPEPVLGINFARDGMDLEEWIDFIASHSDVWLISVALYFMGANGFGRTERERLFDMINELPTILEVVSAGPGKKQSDEEGSSNCSIKKCNCKGKLPTLSQLDALVVEQEAPCGGCERYYLPYEFWIRCDCCWTWFHGKCARISTEMARHMEQYECPVCIRKRRESSPTLQLNI